MVDSSRSRGSRDLCELLLGGALKSVKGSGVFFVTRVNQTLDRNFVTKKSPDPL
ncbi:MAG: hypothetical protein QF918_00520 [Pirellulaceae bacterium]|nr:hypothetical protein [Pirellulaceae bacterium]